MNSHNPIYVCIVAWPKVGKTTPKANVSLCPQSKKNAIVAKVVDKTLGIFYNNAGANTSHHAFFFYLNFFNHEFDYVVCLRDAKISNFVLFLQNVETRAFNICKFVVWRFDDCWKQPNHLLNNLISNKLCVCFFFRYCESGWQNSSVDVRENIQHFE